MEEQTGTSHQSTSVPDTSSFRPGIQADSASPPPHLSSSSLTSSSATSTPASSATLRFPEPEGNHLLANWVISSSADSTSTADIMSPPSISDESSSLADSAYELISSTDGESQDGRATASLSDSLELYPRTDDVQSLSGNDTAYDDDDSSSDEDEDNHSHGHRHRHAHAHDTPSHSYLVNDGTGGEQEDRTDLRSSRTDSIQYAENVLGNPSTQSFSAHEYDSSASADFSGQTPLVQSIEFSESDVYLEKVSVKHTTREFDELETAAIALNLDMADPPKRLAATIRQTMSHRCLSTSEPLRVLYVGSDAGYNDIMYKISSAMLASAPPNHSDPSSDHTSTPNIYNIMPISSFGSTKVPEIDEIQLMGVSDYYIKVERCTKAEETVYEGEAFPNDTVYSLTLDNEKKYLSIFCPSGSVVRPQWTLPHLAVFYVSGNDDSRAEATRNAAWEFMTRHAVPSLFISNSQSFSRSKSAGRWQDFVDQAAVHLCVESRDPERPTAPERLPIDLVSFLNIDARQMNRNLAYLTGLHASQLESKNSGLRGGRNEGDSKLDEGVLAGLLQFVYGFRKGASSVFCNTSQAMAEIRHHLGVDGWTTMAVAATSVLVWTAILLYIPFWSSASIFASRSAVTGTTSLTPLPLGTPVVSVVTDPSVSTVTTPACLVSSLTPTVTISLTSTKTVKLGMSEPSSSTAHFGGFLTDKAEQSTTRASDIEIKRTGCSIHAYSSNEILVKVPSGTKTTWLAKGAIDIDVWRGQEILKSKLSTTDEGIIIEIDRKDAYGVMNVSIVTTRRPRINETFAIDFGKPTMSRLLDAGADFFWDSTQALAKTGRQVATYVEKAASPYVDGGSLPWSAQDIVDGASSMMSAAASTAATSVAAGVKHFGQVALNATDGAGQDVQKKLETMVSTTVDKLVHDAQALLGQATQQLHTAEQLRDDAGLSILRLQVASKLWWLRVQGKTAEHTDYETKASRFIHEKEKAAQAKFGGARGAKKTSCGGRSGKVPWNRRHSKEKQAPGRFAGKWKMRALG